MLTIPKRMAYLIFDLKNYRKGIGVSLNLNLIEMPVV